MSLSRSFERPARFCVLVAFLAAMPAVCLGASPPQIKLSEFHIEPTTLRPGESFTIHAGATASGVKLGSFLLRTADDVPKDPAIPGFPLYSGGKYYVAEAGKYFLIDNGRLDGDPQPGAFSLRVSTEGWRPGTYRLAFFASCRPSEGPFVTARHDFAVVVADNRVVIEDLGDAAVGQSRAITAMDVTSAEIEPGQPVALSLDAAAAIRGVEITNPYYIEPDETLPGFFYLDDQKKSFYGEPPSRVLADNGSADRDPARGRIVLHFDTARWPAGVHHFRLNAIGLAGLAVDYRPFAVKVQGPNDRLKVTVEASSELMPGTHFEKFLKLGDGTLLYADKISRDGGRTWQSGTGGFGVGGVQLADGRALGLQYRFLPEKDASGWYDVERFLSADGGRSFEKTQARVYVPQAKGAMGHGPHVGPLYMRSIVQRRDGSLVALMAGWFVGDDTPCPYGRGRPYSRSYTCESSDAGLTWRYLGPIAYDTIGSEGYNEGSMRRLPGGDWLAVLRTGSESDVHCQDNPIMWTTSRDEGRTWSPPQRTGVEGAFPSLAVLSDGRVAMSYGRPGAMLVFSADGGRTWSDPTAVDPTPYSGYTDVVEIEPGVLLVGFGAKDYLDPVTGVRSDQIRLARVHYELASPKKGP